MWLKELLGAFFFGIRDLLNGITNTVWGVTILMISMYVILQHPDSSAVAYYFAGVASTLLGIKGDHAPSPTSSASTTIITEKTNAQSDRS